MPLTAVLSQQCERGAFYRSATGLPARTRVRGSRKWERSSTPAEMARPCLFYFGTNAPLGRARPCRRFRLAGISRCSTQKGTPTGEGSYLKREYLPEFALLAPGGQTVAQPPTSSATPPVPRPPVPPDGKIVNGLGCRVLRIPQFRKIVLRIS